MAVVVHCVAVLGDGHHHCVKCRNGQFTTVVVVHIVVVQGVACGRDRVLANSLACLTCDVQAQQRSQRCLGVVVDHSAHCRCQFGIGGSIHLRLVFSGHRQRGLRDAKHAVGRDNAVVRVRSSGSSHTDSVIAYCLACLTAQRVYWGHTVGGYSRHRGCQVRISCTIYLRIVISLDGDGGWRDAEDTRLGSHCVVRVGSCFSCHRDSVVVHVLSSCAVQIVYRSNTIGGNTRYGSCQSWVSCGIVVIHLRLAICLDGDGGWFYLQMSVLHSEDHRSKVRVRVRELAFCKTHVICSGIGALGRNHIINQCGICRRCEREV